MAPRFMLGLLLGLALGCGDDHAGGGGSAAAGTGGESGASTQTSGGGGAGGAGGAEPCVQNEVALLFDGQRLYVPVELEDESVLFFVDSGSSLTFVNLGPDAPAFVEDAATIRIGCETLTIPGRGGLAPLGDAFDLPVVGLLGADFLIASTSLLDQPGERLLRPAPADIIDEARAWSVLPYDDVQGHIIAPVTLDDEPVRLMLDTGAAHTLWLGQEGQPGDQEVKTTDGEGNPLVFYYGEVELTMAERMTATVPILRAPSFPYFEQTVAALGGNIHGLLGLSSFQGRALLFDGDANEVRLAPR